MSELTEAELAAFRARLRQMLDELRELQTSSGDGGVDLDQSKVGRLSRMDALQRRAMDENVTARRDQAIRAATAALVRLDTGDFGYCTTCGEPMNPQRLELDPAAALCIGCAEAAER